MTDEQLIIRLIQSHKESEYFDYSKAVDWAIDLIRQGKETDNVLILASFSKPFDRLIISPYVTKVLIDYGLEEFDCKNAVIAEAHYLLNEILNDREIRKNLRSLYKLCMNNDYEFGLMNFYLINHGWDELEETGVNFYFDGVDLDDIKQVLKNEARKWIDKYVHEKKSEEIRQKPITEEVRTSPRISFSSKRVNSANLHVNPLNKLWSWLTGKE